MCGYARCYTTHYFLSLVVVGRLGWIEMNKRISGGSGFVNWIDR